jgi:hypothetical protein
MLRLPPFLGITLASLAPVHLTGAESSVLLCNGWNNSTERGNHQLVSEALMNPAQM